MGAKLSRLSRKKPACPGLAGDLIVFQRTIYKLYAVNVGNGEIVHLTSSAEGMNSSDAVLGIAAHICSANPENAVIKKEKYEDFYKEGDIVYVEELEDGHLPRPVIVKRAKSRIGQRGYDLLNYNCEQFARWCCYGVWESTQATVFIALILIVLIYFLSRMLNRN